MRFLRHLLAFAMTAIMVGCGQPKPAPEAAARTSMAVNIGGEPSTLDPNRCYGVPEHQVLSNIFEPLARLDENMQPQAGVAERWEHNEDFTVWTFHLRADAKWNNGDPVTAGDFAFALQRILKPETTAEYALMVYSFLKGGRAYFDGGGKDPSLLGISTPDDRTLVIELEAPTPYFISLVNHTSWYPLHRPTVERLGENWWMTPGDLVGNGAFDIAEFMPKDRIVIRKSDTYWDRANVEMEEVTFRFIEVEQTELAAYEAGDIDVTHEIPNRVAEELKTRPDFRAVPSLGIYYFSFNVTRPPFDDVALRRAFALAIDRDVIAERITRRGEIPARGFIPASMVLDDGRSYRDVAGSMVDERPLPERVAEARRILAEAGYGSAKPLPRASYLFNTSDVHSDIAQALQTMWKTGIDANVAPENTEWGVYLERGKKHDFDMKRGGWIGDYSDPLTFLDTFEPGSELNNSGYASPRFKELLAQARAASDPQKRVEFLVEAERLLIQEDVVVVPLYDYVWPVMVRPGLEGVGLTPLHGLELKHARWRAE